MDETVFDNQFDSPNQHGFASSEELEKVLHTLILISKQQYCSLQYVLFFFQQFCSSFLLHDKETEGTVAELPLNESLQVENVEELPDTVAGTLSAPDAISMAVAKALEAATNQATQMESNAKSDLTQAKFDVDLASEALKKAVEDSKTAQDKAIQARIVAEEAEIAAIQSEAALDTARKKMTEAENKSAKAKAAAMVQTAATSVISRIMNIALRPLKRKNTEDAGPN